MKKIMFEILLDVIVKMNKKYLASFMDDSVIMGADADNEAKSYDETSFNEKKGTCKTQDFYVLLAYLLITITLLIAVSIHC